MATDTETRLTRSPAMQWEPALSADHVVWEDHRNGKADIYIARLDRLPPRP